MLSHCGIAVKRVYDLHMIVRMSVMRILIYKDYLPLRIVQIL